MPSDTEAQDTGAYSKLLFCRITIVKFSKIVVTKRENHKCEGISSPDLKEINSRMPR